MADMLAPKNGGDIYVEQPVVDTSLGSTFNTLASIGNSFVKSSQRSGEDSTSARLRAFGVRASEIENTNWSDQKKRQAHRANFINFGGSIDQAADAYAAATGKDLGATVETPNIAIMRQWREDPNYTGFMLVAQKDVPNGTAAEQEEYGLNMFLQSQAVLARQAVSSIEGAQQVSAVGLTLGAHIQTGMKLVEESGGITNITKEQAMQYFQPALELIDAASANLDPSDKDNLAALKRMRELVVSIRDDGIGYAHDNPADLMQYQITRDVAENMHSWSNEDKLRGLMILKAWGGHGDSIRAMELFGPDRLLKLKETEKAVSALLQETTPAQGVKPLFPDLKDLGKEDIPLVRGNIDNSIAVITLPVDPNKMKEMKGRGRLTASVLKTFLEMNKEGQYANTDQFARMFGNSTFMNNLKVMSEVNPSEGDYIISLAISALNEQEAILEQQARSIVEQSDLIIVDGEISLNRDSIIERYGDKGERFLKLFDGMYKGDLKAAALDNFGKMSATGLSDMGGMFVDNFSAGGKAIRHMADMDRIRKWRSKLQGDFGVGAIADPKRVG